MLVDVRRRISTKIDRVRRRHRMPTLPALAYESFVRSYRNRYLRNVYRSILGRRKKPLGWVFMAGCYNAGTTVIKNAVSLHPDVSTPPVEGDMLTSGLSNFEVGGWPRAMLGNAYEIEKFRSSGKINLDGVLRDWSPWIKPDRSFVEKSIANTTRIKDLRQSFSPSKFVCISRSPDAVVSGIQKRSSPTGLARKYLDSDAFSDQFLYSQWYFMYSMVLQDAEASDTCFCSYEAFLSDPVQTLSALFHFLDLRPVDISFSDDQLSVDGVRLYIRPLANTPSYRAESKTQLKHELAELRARQDIFL